VAALFLCFLSHLTICSCSVVVATAVMPHASSFFVEFIFSLLYSSIPIIGDWLVCKIQDSQKEAQHLFVNPVI